MSPQPVIWDAASFHSWNDALREHKRLEVPRVTESWTMSTAHGEFLFFDPKPNHDPGDEQQESETR